MQLVLAGIGRRYFFLSTRQSVDVFFVPLQILAGGQSLLAHFLTTVHQYMALSSVMDFKSLKEMSKRLAPMAIADLQGKYQTLDIREDYFQVRLDEL